MQGYGSYTILDSNFALKDSANLDAFSRLRTSEPVSLFDSQFQYDLDPLRWEAYTTGTGVAATHSANTRMAEISVTAGNGTSGIQTYQYFSYQAAKSQMVAQTFVIGAAVSGAVVDVMYGDANNGIYFRQNGINGLQILRLSSTSGAPAFETKDQVDWNIDKMDGTGPSGKTLDITKSQILVIDLQFLGMGRVRVGFDIDGILYYCHEFLNANNLSVPYMQSATLPCGMMITTSGTAVTKTSYYKCCAVISEGGFEYGATKPNVTPEMTVTAGNGTRTAIASIRPRTTFNAITNRSSLASIGIDITVTGTNPVFWELVIGAAWTVNPTYSNINTSNSAFEYSSAPGTFNNLTNGVVIDKGYCQASNQAKQSVSQNVLSKYPISLDRSGAVRANGTLTLLVTGIGGASATRCSLSLEEIR